MRGPCTSIAKTDCSSDDEYRLLRQSVFEQHAGDAVPPVEAPLVSIERRKLQRASLTCTAISLCSSPFSGSPAAQIIRT